MDLSFSADVDITGGQAVIRTIVNPSHVVKRIWEICALADSMELRELDKSN